LVSDYNISTLFLKGHQPMTFLFKCIEVYLSSMQSMRWLAILAAGVLITACFFPWISVEQKNFFVGGFNSSADSRYGQPGLFHTIFCSIYIFLLLLNRIWSIRTAFFLSAFNIAWTIRNYIAISACSGGICPEKHTALFVLLIGSILLIVFPLLIEVKPK
jgi:hypothetical protein